MDKPSDLAITGSLEQLVQLNALTNNNVKYNNLLYSLV